LGCHQLTSRFGWLPLPALHPDGDEVGVYETLASNWQVGDVLELPRGGRFRIVSILDLDESYDASGTYQAAFMVEPAHETIVHHVEPKWFCHCEGPDGMVWHSLDDRDGQVCGDDLDQILRARASR
jgi:hypothetical protein